FRHLQLPLLQEQSHTASNYVANQVPQQQSLAPEPPMIRGGVATTILCATPARSTAAAGEQNAIQLQSQSCSNSSSNGNKCYFLNPFLNKLLWPKSKIVK
ncbi:hypothetical protein HPP92_027742, partial [Vanilla planifolia]